MRNDGPEPLILKLSGLWTDSQDHVLLAGAVRALESRYNLMQKIASEPGVQDIVLQMFGRLARSFAKLSDIRGQRILDIACGSSTSRAPAALQIDTPFGSVSIGRGASRGFTAQFEPWFCRILLELGAEPVGVDLGDLDQEAFAHHRVDLGQPGALDFLPDRSFDAVQDSRLFGSPEFTARFAKRADRLRVAQEIRRQENRLLKPGGVVIHSDAAALLQ